MFVVFFVVFVVLFFFVVVVGCLVLGRLCVFVSIFENPMVAAIEFDFGS